MTGSDTTGYDIVDIETGEREDFLRQNGGEGEGKIGRFTICEKGFRKGGIS